MASTKSTNRFPLLALAMAMAVGVASAQNTPQDFVNLHNRERAKVGVGPVAWDDTVAKVAQDFAATRAADRCRLKLYFGPYGANMMAAQGFLIPASLTAADAVKAWVSEKRYYRRDSNTCVRENMCKHYTQVVWRNSTRIGCARVTCPEVRQRSGVFIICNYDPPGNIGGERPFEALDAEAK